MRQTRPSESQYAVQRALARIEMAYSDIPLMFARLREWSSDVGSSSGSVGPKNQVGDPTGNTAVNTTDENARMIAELHAICDSIHRDSLDLDRIRRHTMAPAIPKQPEERGLEKCKNMHGCPDDAWAWKAGRCDACHTYWRRNERDRTPRTAA